MTLNEWEQSNIEVLTSREMGEWLCRRENRLFGKIKDEIEDYVCNHETNTDKAQGMLNALQILDKYR